MDILFFLLETLFFFLMAAALLRAWMNHLRIPMSAQPGRFVVAVTDWLVQPLRRVLPRSMAQGRIDWGSVVAALLLAMVYGVLRVLVLDLVHGGVLPGATAVSLAFTVGVRLLGRVVLQGLTVLLIVYAVMSWVQPHAPAMYLLHRLCEPVLRPIRRVVPLVGGVDLSVLVAVVLLQVGLRLLG
jgi:YggT family protein